MPTAKRLEKEVEGEVVTQKEGVTIEEETPVAASEEESDSNEFTALTAEMDAEDKVVDFGLEEEETGEESTSTIEDDAPAGEPEPQGEEPLAAAEEEKAQAEELTAPTEEPTPEVEAAAETEPEVQTTESETPEEKPEEPEPGESYETLRTEALAELEEEFKFSEEDAQTLVTEPEKILPKLAADLYMRAYETITKTINASLPEMISSVMTRESLATQATDAFYTKWGKLDRNDKKHSEVVNRIGMTYRQVNPEASQEQFIAEVGAQALLALGVPFEEIIDAPPVERPFVPAAPAASAPEAPVAKPLGPYETLANEFLDDDS